MVSVLQRGPLADRLRWHDGRLAGEDELAAVHDPAYIAMLRDACEQGGRVFAPSTLVTGESWQPLLAAAGTAMAAGDAVISGGVADRLRPGAPARPPRRARPRPTATASSTTWRWWRSGRSRPAASGWRSSTGTCTTETARRPASTTAPTCSRSRCTCATAAGGRRTPQTGSAAEVGVGRRGRPQRQRRAGPGQRHPRLRGGLDGGDPADPRSVPARPDRGRVRTGRERLRSQRPPEPADGRVPPGRPPVAEAADELCDGRLVLVQEGGYARTYAAYCLHATLEGVLDARAAAGRPDRLPARRRRPRRRRHRRPTHLPVAVLAPALIR